jgi:hypothetical protein
MAAGDRNDADGAGPSGKKSKSKKSQVKAKKKQQAEESTAESVDATMEQEEAPAPPGKKGVFLPGKPMEAGETLVCDKSVYNLFQKFRVGE